MLREWNLFDDKRIRKNSCIYHDFILFRNTFQKSGSDYLRIQELLNWLVSPIVNKNRLAFTLIFIRYIMSRYTSSTLLFDERFVNYGCDKIQYIEHLRSLGKSFYLITRSFAMDIAHHEY